MKNLVIIGGSDAGISAALRARELNRDIEPTLIVADRFPNFSICGLPYYISREVSRWENLAHRSKEEIEKEGIRLMLEHRAESIDPQSKTVSVADKSGTIKSLHYDKLVIGTGGVSLKPAFPGIDTPGVFLLRWMSDCFAIDEYITRRKPASALIIGGGYIGMEMSEALRKRGMNVTVVEYAGTVMPSFDTGIGSKIIQTLRTNGVMVYNNVSVESIDATGGFLTVRGSKGFSMNADLVLVSVGAIPNTELGRSMGLETGIKGAYKVNRKMETGVPGIYAAGDCAETWHGLLQQYTYLPLGTVAHKQGRIAGENAAGGDIEFAGSLGTQSVKIFDAVAARTGLNDREAAEAGFSPVSANFETWDHKVYYPAAEKLFIRVTADRKTKKILGAQMLGAYGTEVSKRIDIFAVALHHNISMSDFSNYDLSYTPPLSSPWDPVQMAVHNLEKLIG